MSETVNLIWLLAGYISLGIKAWALSDILKAPAEAFPFLNRQTKNIWIAISLGSVLGHLLFGAWGFTGVIGLIACAVHLADTRPKIREMTGRK
ncbi:hypothetical protein GM51_8750 [freshwater metagenome]|uniref:DUF2516 family protein n=1 Tax=freshwater metagenome TaxID=449393 RepID=A0A094QVB3_9ZZZZ